MHKDQFLNLWLHVYQLLLVHFQNLHTMNWVLIRINWANNILPHEVHLQLSLEAKKGMWSAREKVRRKRSGQREDAPKHSPFNSLTRPTLIDDKAECRLCFGRRKTRNTFILLKEIVLCRNLRALLRSRRYDSAGCCDQSDCLTSTGRWKFLPPKPQRWFTLKVIEGPALLICRFDQQLRHDLPLSWWKWRAEGMSLTAAITSYRTRRGTVLGRAVEQSHTSSSNGPVCREHETRQMAKIKFLTQN